MISEIIKSLHPDLKIVLSIMSGIAIAAMTVTGVLSAGIGIAGLLATVGIAASVFEKYKQKVMKVEVTGWASIGAHGNATVKQMP